MNDAADRIQDHLIFVYGKEKTEQIWPALAEKMERFREQNPYLQKATVPPEQRLTEADAVLITYGDQVQEPGKPPLQTLGEVLAEQASDLLSSVHLLPFYPYSSDDGFSVIDYKQVNPAFGTWNDVHRIGENFRLMFDAVINHISRESAWFQGFLQGKEPYTDYFIVVDPNTDLSSVVRPRTTPLLTPVQTVHGLKYVWTTFSDDQIDLNYANPQVLLDVIDVLLFYVEQGARLIRLDAIAFLWKEIGTSCLHLPQTHRIIQLFRAILDHVAPDVLLITETNVPHEENISYFGDGTNEAQMVYNFALPPLTLHTFYTGNAQKLSEWARTLRTPSNQTTFFNFMASHDGVGVRPVEQILSAQEITNLVDRTLAHGGFVSYKTNPDGSQSPYELNIVYYDALNDPHSDEPQSLQVDRFMASQAILVGLVGVPGIYVHSLFGSRNWQEGVRLTGRNRTINRQKFQRRDLEQELSTPGLVRHQVFTRYAQLLRTRRRERAFHPSAPMDVLLGDPAFFTFVRTSVDGDSRVLCIHNVTNRPQTFWESVAPWGLRPEEALIDLLTNAPYTTTANADLRLTVPPYGVLWLKSAG
jgi:sucrose phosphorylase